jgi:hypothetical protein
MKIRVRCENKRDLSARTVWQSEAGNTFSTLKCAQFYGTISLLLFVPSCNNVNKNVLLPQQCTQKACSSHTTETPPWGDTKCKESVWEEGRLILHDPTTLDMKGVFLELGFYESSRDTMADWIRSKSAGDRILVSKNFLYFRGDGADPQLELTRKYQDEQIVFEVFVENSSGPDHSISWHYKLRYLPSKNRWVFLGINPVRNHKWNIYN